MTYNIHHGKGTDGKVNLRRIAQVIEQSEAELVALNEVDKHFSKRSNYVDQATWLAQRLNMNMVFGASVSLNEESRQYGNAFLSRYPVLSFKNHSIHFGTSLVEERSVLESTFLINGKRLKAYVTHVSMFPFAHRKQINLIIEKISNDSEPYLLFGDWNMTSKSKAWKKISMHASDSWSTVNQTKGSTFPSIWPFLRLDYIFSSPSIPIVEATIIQGVSMASDHLPLRAIFRIEE